MATLDRPRLRPVRPFRVVRQGQPFIAFDDSLGVADPDAMVPLEWYRLILRHCDGTRSRNELQALIRQETGEPFPSQVLDTLIDQLDQARVLDGPSYAAFLADYQRDPIRPPAFAGRCYRRTEWALRSQLERYFHHDQGAGPPRTGADQSTPLRGILSPHIDFDRGGPTYTWAYRELVERSDADLFVILGVAHQACERRFALTRKDFLTPLGLARTDRGFVDRLARAAGTHLFDDELAHRTEHSIEFQVVFLQYLLESRPFTIVPILVGSFHDLMTRGLDPINDPQVRRLVDALRETERESGRRVAYIGGIDLGHVGPEFGDPDLLDDVTLDQLRRFDAAMLESAGRGDAATWFARAAAVGNRWRVCGLAATYTFLQAIGPVKGRVLRYNQAVNAERTCGVSFASAAFESAGA